jgi:hypothetical protein
VHEKGQDEQEGRTEQYEDGETKLREKERERR